MSISRIVGHPAAGHQQHSWPPPPSCQNLQSVEAAAPEPVYTRGGSVGRVHGREDAALGEGLANHLSLGTVPYFGVGLHAVHPLILARAHTKSKSFVIFESAIQRVLMFFSLW